MTDSKAVVIAVDFDDTLDDKEAAGVKWPEIGKPRKDLIDALERARKKGHILIFNTCRTDDLKKGKFQLNEALCWCAWSGLWFDYINKNEPKRIKKYGADCRKISADFYVEDKAHLDWPAPIPGIIEYLDKLPDWSGKKHPREKEKRRKGETR